MNKTTEALKLAEEALEELHYSSGTVKAVTLYRHALAAIREALAEPVKQEPIAWEATSAGVIKFVTDSRYKKFSQNIQQYYKPYRCSHCSEPVKQEPVKMMNSVGNTEAYLPGQQTSGFDIPLYAAPVDAKAIRAEALDEAAKVCEQDEFQIYETAERCAAAIRGLK